MKIEIDGPYNVVRMEGKINNVKKVLYIFFDIHFDLCQQKICENIRSKNITKYFVEQFDEIEKDKDEDKEIDFFLEIYPSNYETKPVNFDSTAKYIWDIHRMYNLIKNDYKKIRFHYFDIRDYLMLNVYNIRSGMEKLIKAIKYDEFINKNDMFNLYDGYGLISDHLHFIKQKFTQNESLLYERKSNFPTKMQREEFSKLSMNDKISKITDLINKIKLKYDNDNIKQFINIIIDNDIVKYLDEYIEKAKKIRNTIATDINKFDENYEKLFIKNIGKFKIAMYQNDEEIIKRYDEQDIYMNTLLLLKCFCGITDAYFLRRFLDKQYIKHAIVYTGGLHSMYFIKKLSELDFKITHASVYNKNFKNINNDIKNIKDIEDMKELFNPLKKSQCSDITNFPKHFS
jgi:hypothetical protein